MLYFPYKYNVIKPINIKQTKKALANFGLVSFKFKIEDSSNIRMIIIELKPANKCIFELMAVVF